MNIIAHSAENCKKEQKIKSEEQEKYSAKNHAQYGSASTMDRFTEKKSPLSKLTTQKRKKLIRGAFLFRSACRKTKFFGKLSQPSRKGGLISSYFIL